MCRFAWSAPSSALLSLPFWVISSGCDLGSTYFPQVCDDSMFLTSSGAAIADDASAAPAIAVVMTPNDFIVEFVRLIVVSTRGELSSGLEYA